VNHTGNPSDISQAAAGSAQAPSLDLAAGVALNSAAQLAPAPARSPFNRCSQSGGRCRRALGDPSELRAAQLRPAEQQRDCRARGEQTQPDTVAASSASSRGRVK